MLSPLLVSVSCLLPFISTGLTTNFSTRVRLPFVSLSATTSSSSVLPPPPSIVAMPAKKDYSEHQMKDALQGLLIDSKDPTYDARHMFGFGDDNHKLSMLQTITATRILDYGEYKSKSDIPSLDDLTKQAADFAACHGPILNLQTVIAEQAPRMALAAEFKRASPSKGAIAMHLDCGEQSKLYASAGANIISCLTEYHWFKGSLEDMRSARLETTITNDDGTGIRRPAILRKDFVVNEYMIAEAAAYGADTILLIVAVLPEHVLSRLIDFARSLGMEPLVEVRADEELDVALKAGAKVIGVNNRNLHTFQMDLGTTSHVVEQLRIAGKVVQHLAPTSASSSNDEVTVCALSGMSSAIDVDRYRQDGVGMCLIGESLMRAADPKRAIVHLCLDPSDYEKQTSSKVEGGGGAAYTSGTKLVKVCGMTNAEDALVACQAGANLIGVIFAPKSKRCVTPEQAKEVVEAVQSFGERSKPVSLKETIDKQIPSTTQSLHKLIASARLLEEASRRPLVVGVFQNQEQQFIADMVARCGLDMVQLHGKEGMEACSNTGGVPAIRVVDIETDPRTGKASETAVQGLLDKLTADPAAILLDTSIQGSKGGGGTGVTFDWSIAKKLQAEGLPVIIAGGLNPGNIQEAISSTQPWGIDVSSGVEASPGRKDHSKVEAFVQGARQAAIEASKGF